MYIYIYVHIHIYTYIHIHTHICLQEQQMLHREHEIMHELQCRETDARTDAQEKLELQVLTLQQREQEIHAREEEVTCIEFIKMYRIS